MHRPPRSRSASIFTRPVVGLIALGGIWSTAVTVSLFASTLASGGGLSEARTTVFATLILIELFKAFSFRSDRRSTLEGTFRNRWLNLAVAWEIVLLTLVINVPFLESAFGTTDLSARTLGAHRRRRADDRAGARARQAARAPILRRQRRGDP